MKSDKSKSIWCLGCAVAIALALGLSTLAQNPKAASISLRLGDATVVIPNPDGFEEAASQFADVKDGFTATEAQGNDMLAVHLLTSDCEKLRHGGAGPFNFYTKISVQRAIRDKNYSAADFAAIPAEFRKNGAAVLDINSPRMKDAVDRIQQAMTERGTSKVGMGQPENLGEFDTRPNRYSVMLMMNLAVQTGDERSIKPLLAGMTFMRVKQRLLYISTYRKFESKADIQVLEDFTKHWTDAILAAN